MKYKTLKGLCNYFAQANQQEKARTLENRYIWGVKDFTEQDNKEIKETAKWLEYTINDYAQITKNYEDFKYLLKQLKDITQYYFYGFLAQDEITNFLPNYNKQEN